MTQKRENDTDLELEINRTIVLLQELSERTDIPVHKFQKLKKILESQFCQNVKDVYEEMYENSDIKEDDSLRASASAKATVAAFTTSPCQSSPATSGEVYAHEEIAVIPVRGECAVIPVRSDERVKGTISPSDYEKHPQDDVLECLEMAVFDNTASQDLYGKDVVATSSQLTPVHQTRVKRVSSSCSRLYQPEG